MKRTWKEMGVRILILFVGLTIAHLGVTLFLLANLGADPFNVLIQGIFRATGQVPGWPIQTHGNTHIVICLLIILILLIVDRSYIKVGTVLCMIFGGPIIDVFTILLADFVQSGDPLIWKIVVNGVGCVILAFGMTIVIKSDAGTGPNDLVAIVTADKLKKNFGMVRILTDVTFVLVGFLLGGAIGIGTVICAFLVGPVANIFLPIHERWINRLLRTVAGKEDRVPQSE